MKLPTPLHASLALLSLTTLSLAQAAPAGKPASAPAAAPLAAPVHRVEPHAISMTVTGLAKVDPSRLEQELKALGMTSYACKACKLEQPSPGKCPTCKAELVASRHEALASVRIAPDEASITVMPASNGSVRLSELETVLSRNSVKVDESRLTLPGSALLVLKGGVAENAAAVEKALQTAKLFDEVHARFDPVRQELDIEVRAGSQAPLRATVARAIEDAGTKARLTDVQWGAARTRT